MAEAWASGYVKRHDFAVVHIQNRRQIQFARRDVKLGNVGCPFLVARRGREVPSVGRSMLLLIDNLVEKEVPASSVLVAFVGVVFPSGRDAVDIEQGHYSFDLFMVDSVSSVGQFEQYSSVAVSSFVLAVYFLYLLKDLFVFAVFVSLVDRVEERRFFNP